MKTEKENYGNISLLELAKMVAQTYPPEDYTEWCKIGMSIKAWGFDFETFNEWSKAGANYNYGTCKEQWEAWKAEGGIGKGTLIYFLKQEGVWKAPEKPQEEYTPGKPRGIAFTNETSPKESKSPRKVTKAEALAKEKQAEILDKRDKAKSKLIIDRINRDRERARSGKTREKAEAYLRGRGITEEEIAKLDLSSGTDKKGEWINIFYPDRPFYITRYTAIAPNGDYDKKKIKKYKYPWGLKGTDRHVFNAPVLAEAGEGQIVGVVEGAIDALTLTQNGIPTIATGNSTVALLAELDALAEAGTPFRGIFACIPDNDPDTGTGDTIAERNCSNLQSRDYRAYIGNIPEEVHDPNDCLLKKPELLAEWCRGELPETIAEAEADREAQEQEEAENYRKNNSALSALAKFMAYREHPTIPISTGITPINHALDGGIFEGLYCISAVPSIGKTALIMQIADNIAEQGKDVLVFALEMSQKELVARSLARLSADLSNLQNCKGLYDFYNYPQDDIADELTHYETKIAPHLYITEGDGSITIEDVEATIKAHKKAQGQTPIVILDYLQYLSPVSEKLTEKQHIDQVVKTLKRITRDNGNAPVIVISSVNRAGYTREASMESAKESGGIEFTADVMAQITFHSLANAKTMKDGNKDFSRTEELKREDSRGYRLADFTVLKNRHGKAGNVATLKMFPKFFFWKGISQEELKKIEEESQKILSFEPPSGTETQEEKPKKPKKKPGHL